MVNLHDAVSLLLVKRSELLDQLQAVDNALAALGGLGVAVTTTPNGRPAERLTDGIVVTNGQARLGPEGNPHTTWPVPGGVRRSLSGDAARVSASAWSSSPMIASRPQT